MGSIGMIILGGDSDGERKDVVILISLYIAPYCCS